jgi:tetratricopeptide (TPR) repeat protein
MANLAVTYYEQKRWEEAEKLELQVVEARKRVLGPEHPDTLTSMHNLAYTYMGQGRRREAKQLEAEAKQSEKKGG